MAPTPTGIQATDDEITALPITRHRFHGDWNYTLHPQHSPDPTAINNTSDRAPTNRLDHLTQRSLQAPELTGMTRQQLSRLIDTLTPALEMQREKVLRCRLRDRVRQDGQAQLPPSEHGEPVQERGKEVAVRRGDAWHVDLPLQDGRLAQCHYLDVLVHFADRQQPYEGEHTRHGKAEQSQQHDRRA